MRIHEDLICESKYEHHQSRSSRLPCCEAERQSSCIASVGLPLNQQLPQTVEATLQVLCTTALIS